MVMAKVPENERCTCNKKEDSNSNPESIKVTNNDLGNVIEIKSIDEFNKIIEEDNLVIADFFATWCGPCRAMAPAMEKMEQKYSDKIEFRKVDIDKNRSLAQKYEIEAVPTLVILSPKGEIINKIVGGQSEKYLDSLFGSL
jgi:thioredoxin 1